MARKKKNNNNQTTSAAPKKEQAQKQSQEESRVIEELFGNLDEALQRQLRSLARMNGRQLAEQRYQKFRQIGEMRKA